VVQKATFFGVLAVTQAMLPLVRNSPAARIITISSGLGSLTWNGDPKWPFRRRHAAWLQRLQGDPEMMTVQLAWELRDTPIKVNTVNPGDTATDLNGNSGTQTVEEGAEEAFPQALAPDDAPTAGFFETGGVEALYLASHGAQNRHRTTNFTELCQGPKSMIRKLANKSVREDVMVFAKRCTKLELR
jgi:NAD(P)-dependent dehydrogenase (short-subunit alcohol dehydrogenase family)